MIRKLLIDNPTIQLLKRGLDASALRQRAVADNIANAGVAGHRPREVQFESLFRRAVHGRLASVHTHPTHRSLADGPVLPQPRVVETEPAGDAAAALEQDLVTLVENAAKERAMLRLLGGSYDAIVTAIRGRLR